MNLDALFKLTNGLYILGEMLNVDGRSGGFNLHFAWGCGYTAAQAMPEE